MIKVNVGTDWEFEYDPTIILGSYIKLTRKWSGKHVGIWEVLELDRVFVDANNKESYAKIDYSNPVRQGYDYHYPPMGMEMPARIKAVRVMGECFEIKPRRDTTSATIDQADKVTLQFISDLQDKYNKRTDNLKTLLNGTW